MGASHPQSSEDGLATISSEAAAQEASLLAPGAGSSALSTALNSLQVYLCRFGAAVGCERRRCMYRDADVAHCTQGLSGSQRQAANLSEQSQNQRSGF